MGSKLISAVIAALLLAVVAFLQGMGLVPENSNPYLDGEVYLHIIDVGQGSSTLIQHGNEGILIDAGEKDYGEKVSGYINSCGIDKLKYVIASHPHSDHIGGLPAVISSFEIEEVLMPELSEENIPTTKVYERFLDAIAENGVSASYCLAGDIYYLGDVSLEILAPVKQTDDLNNMSAVCRISAGQTDITVLGDAEKQEIKSFFRDGEIYESEILVMGHHGSRTSIYAPYLEQVNPIEAVISCGKDNSYGHPHQEAIDYLEENSITYWRTDYQGDIVYRIDEYGFERIEKQ